jgi:hypothetical protein
MRTLALLVPLLHAVSAGACEVGSTGTASAAIVADQRCLAQEAAIPDADLGAVRAMAVAVVHPAGSSALMRGLEELAQAEPARHACRTANLADRAWYAKGGVGHYQAGSGNRSAARIEAFVKRIDSERLDGAVQAAYLELDPRDFPEGRTAEVSWTSYSTTMALNLSSARLAGVFTETLQAPQVITTGNGSFISQPRNYPIELPNVTVDHVSTMVQVPSGGHPGDNSIMVPRLSDRDPRVAIGTYGDTMATLEKTHASIAFVYGTVPLAAKGNWQRNAYNQAVRALSADRGRPLFDAAAILSRRPDGSVATDEQGERLAPEYIDAATGGIGKLGRERLARAWWWTMARMKGWTAETGGDATPTAADGG